MDEWKIELLEKRITELEETLTKYSNEAKVLRVVNRMQEGRIKEFERMVADQTGALKLAVEFGVKMEESAKKYRAALEKIASGWIDPAVGGDCKDCDMGLYQNLGHLPECVFEIAREALKGQG